MKGADWKDWLQEELMGMRAGEKEAKETGNSGNTRREKPHGRRGVLECACGSCVP